MPLTPTTQIERNPKVCNPKLIIFSIFDNPQKVVSRKKLSLRPKLPVDREDTLCTLSSLIGQTSPEGARMVKVVNRGIVLLFTDVGLNNLCSHDVLFEMEHLK